MRRHELRVGSRQVEGLIVRGAGARKVTWERGCMRKDEGCSREVPGTVRHPTKGDVMAAGMGKVPRSGSLCEFLRTTGPKGTQSQTQML